MQLTHAAHRRAAASSKCATGGHSPTQPASAGRPDISRHAVAEINAFIAIRDSLLAGAEALTTATAIDRAAIANEVLEKSLAPARSPYEAQNLGEVEADDQRTRCRIVKRRLAQLASIE